MAAPGTPFESPRACPFVALELDRDRRSDKPDYRHRCFAEPTPAPRSIAHQEAFCLSPNFAGCPVFQDWAVRAAAHPVEPAAASAASDSAADSDEAPSGAAIGAAALGGAAVSGAALGGAAALNAATDDDAADPVDDEPVAADTPPASAAAPAPAPPDFQSDPPMHDAPAQESALYDLPEDASVTPAGAEIAAAAAAVTGMGPALASPPTFATTDWQSEAHESEQLGVFDAPPDDSGSTSDPHSSYGQPDAGYPEAPEPPGAFVPPPTRPSQQSTPAEQAATVAAPAFLAGRSSRPTAAPTNTAGATPPPAKNMSRDELVPSWELDGRYGAEPPHEQGSGGGGRLDGILTAIAVIAILALGVAAVLFLPGLLNKGSAPKTPLPSFVLPSGLPSALPSAIASVPASIGPSVAPTSVATAPASEGPVGSPRLYKIKAGDSLARIANKFDVLVQQILDANPEISDPNNIFVGQIIVIPLSGTPTAAP